MDNYAHAMHHYIRGNIESAVRPQPPEQKAAGSNPAGGHQHSPRLAWQARLARESGGQVGARTTGAVKFPVAA